MIALYTYKIDYTGVYDYSLWFIPIRLWILTGAGVVVVAFLLLRGVHPALAALAVVGLVAFEVLVRSLGKTEVLNRCATVLLALFTATILALILAGITLVVYDSDLSPIVVILISIGVAVILLLQYMRVYKISRKLGIYAGLTIGLLVYPWRTPDIEGLRELRELERTGRC